MRRNSFIAIAAIAGLVLAGVAYASVPDAGGVIHGCYQKTNGQLRVIDSGAACVPSETALNWNQVGARGPTGSRGPTGAAGKDGKDGTKGATGARGPTGTNGTNGLNGADGVAGPTGPAEAVGATSVQITPPATPTAQGGISAPSTFTTTISGKLVLTKQINAFLHCQPAFGVWWWITLDGSVVQSSFTLTGDTTSSFSQTLTGVTSSSVAAGNHTMEINAMCYRGTAVDSEFNVVSNGTATVVG